MKARNQQSRKRFDTDSFHTESHDRGVSPVIGVVLMVAVTVVLAAAIAAFVFPEASGVGNSAPNVQLDFSKTNGGDVEIRHAGGDPVDTDDVTVKVAGSTVSGVFTQDQLTADDRGTIDASSVTAGDRVAVIYTNSDGETTVLAAWEVP